MAETHPLSTQTPADVQQRQQQKQKAKDERQKAGKENYEKGRELQDKILAERAERDAPNVKPTPTEEEIVMAMNGAHVDNKEPDGSPEQPSGAVTPAQAQSRSMEAKPGHPQQQYATRQATPKKEDK